MWGALWGRAEESREPRKGRRRSQSQSRCEERKKKRGQERTMEKLETGFSGVRTEAGSPGRGSLDLGRWSFFPHTGGPVHLESGIAGSVSETHWPAGGCESALEIVLSQPPTPTRTLSPASWARQDPLRAQTLALASLPRLSLPRLPLPKEKVQAGNRRLSTELRFLET